MLQNIHTTVVTRISRYAKMRKVFLFLDPERDYQGSPGMPLRSGRDPKPFRRSAGTLPSWHAVFQGCLAPHRMVLV